MPTIEELIAQAEQASAPQAQDDVDALIGQAEQLRMPQAQDDVDSLIAQAEAAAPPTTQAPHQLVVMHPSGDKKTIHPSELGQYVQQGYNIPESEGTKRINAALESGLANNITGRGVNLVSNAIVGRDALNPNFQPQTPTEYAAKYGAEFLLDPAAFAIGGAATKYALKGAGLMKPAERLARLSSDVLSQGGQAIARKAATRIGLVGAGAAGAAISGTEAAITALEEGEIDPVTGLAKVALGGGLGAAAGGVLGRMGFNAQQKAARARESLQKVYGTDVGKELDTVAFNLSAKANETPEQFLARADQKRRQMITAHDRLTKLEDIRGRLLSKLDDAKPGNSQIFKQRLAQTTLQMADEQQKFFEAYGDDTYKALIDLKKAYGGTKAVINGKRVNVLDTALSKRGVMVDPDALKAAQNIPQDVNRATFLYRDPKRTLQQAEGLNGPVYQLALRPLEEASVRAQQAETAILEQFNKFAKPANVSKWNWTDHFSAAGRARRQTSVRIFDAIEDKSGQLYNKLDPKEQSLINHMKDVYEKVLNDQNAQRAVANLPPIAKRDNYISHIHELNLLERMGIRLGQDELPKSTGKYVEKYGQRLNRISQRFESRRTGAENFSKDVFSAFSQYTSNAQRTIHLTQARNQALALTELMDNTPNLQRGMARFLHGPVFGGLDSKTALVVDNVGEWLPPLADLYARTFTRGTAGGNINILAQQFSNIPFSISMSGAGNTARALPALFDKESVHPAFYTKSVLGRQRQAAAELGKQFGATPTTLPGKAMKGLDSAYRWTSNAADTSVARFNWQAAFLKGQRQGLTEDAAVRYADDVAKALNGIYSELYRPELLQGPIGRAMFPLQTYAFNWFNMLTSDLPKFARAEQKNIVRKYAEYVGTVWATNHIYESMGIPSPIDLGMLDVNNYKMNDSGDLEFVGYSAIPMAGPLAVAQDSDLKRRAGLAKEAAKAAYKYLLDDEADEDEELEKLVDASSKLGKNFIPYGQQIYTTAKGVKAVQDGYYKIGSKEIELEGAAAITAPFVGPPRK